MIQIFSKEEVLTGNGVNHEFWFSLQVNYVCCSEGRYHSRAGLSVTAAVPLSLKFFQMLLTSSFYPHALF